MAESWISTLTDLCSHADLLTAKYLSERGVAAGLARLLSAEIVKLKEREVKEAK
jgi:hypothetical protein